MTNSTEEPRFDLTTSPTIGAIAAAMAKAQLEMGPAAKDRENPHFRSMYATLASCLEACKPMHANGIAIFQPPQPAGIDGVHVTTLLVHASGEWLRGDLFMPVSKRDAQGFGSALTYARRYCLSSTVGLGTDDDDGNEATKAKPGTAKAPQAQPQRAPASTAPAQDVFAILCARVDEAEVETALNQIASVAMKAHKAGDIGDGQLAHIKAAVTKKRADFAPAAANGGAA